MLSGLINQQRMNISPPVQTSSPSTSPLGGSNPNHLPNCSPPPAASVGGIITSKAEDSPKVSNFSIAALISGGGDKTASAAAAGLKRSMPQPQNFLQPPNKLARFQLGKENVFYNHFRMNDLY